MKPCDRLSAAGECGFSIQTNNRAESVSVNGDQACLGEGFGDSEGSGTPLLSLTLSLPLFPSASICLSFLNTELTSCIRREKDASSLRCQNVIWALSWHFHITVVRCWLAEHTAVSFLYCFLCFAILCLCLFLHLHLLFLSLFSIFMSVSPFICLPCKQTLYSSIASPLPLSVFLFLFFFSHSLFLSHLERNIEANIKKPVSHCGAFWRSPWKQIAFRRERQAQTAESPHCCSTTSGLELWPPPNEAGLMRLESPSVPPPAPRSSSSCFVQTCAMWVFQHHRLRTAPTLLSFCPLLSDEDFSAGRSWTAPIVYPRAGWLNRGTRLHYRWM